MPEARQRAAFELLRFSAMPVGSGLAVVELEGRFAQRGRFAREPVLVVERDGDEPRGGRLELAPVTAALEAERFTGVYAVPADALDDGRFALGVRGTLLDLPAPDRPDDGERLAALAREANGLRRALELAEAEGARAREEAATAAAETAAAVAAAREAAEAAAAERLAALQRELTQAREDAAAQRLEADQALLEARAEAAAAHEAAMSQLRERAAAAEARAEAVQQTAAAERAEVLAEREAALAELRERAEVAGAGTDVLRAELAEERDRSQARIAELQERLAAAQAARDAGTAGTTVAPVLADQERDDPTVALAPPADADGERAPDDPTDTYDLPAAAIARPRPVADRGASTPVVDPVHHAGPGLSRWIAVAALALFLFALLGLLLGFLN
jgi:hypothetical protein